MGYERLMNAWADVRRCGVRVVESSARLRAFADRLDMFVLPPHVAEQSHLPLGPAGPGDADPVVVGVPSGRSGASHGWCGAAVVVCELRRVLVCGVLAHKDVVGVGPPCQGVHVRPVHVGVELPEESGGRLAV